MKTAKTIAIITTAAFLNAVVVMPAYASTSTMIDDTQKQVQTAPVQSEEYKKMEEQQKAQQQQVQQSQQQFNINNPANTTTTRQTVYDKTTGEIITLVKSGIGVTAYNNAGQQVAMQADWINQANVATTTPAQQLAAIAATIKTDSSLNTVGKLVKALLALEAIKQNNQLMREQYARQIAEQKQAKAQQNPVTQQTAKTQKKDSSTAKSKGEVEYASVLRDNDKEHGGTTSSSNIANPELAKQSTEAPLTIDLIGKIVDKDDNTLTIEDATGRKINVKVSDPENYSVGDNLNATGRILAGSDANLYVMQDEESGMGVQVSKISDETYNYKAEQQQAAAEQFAQQYPEAAGLAGTGAAGQYQAPAPAPEEDTTITEISGTGEALVPPTTNEGYSESSDDDGPGLLSQAGDWIMSHKMQIAGGASIVAGGALLIGSGALTLASGATLTPLAALQAKAGSALISAGVGAFALGTFNNYAEEQVEERHPNSITQDLRQKGNNLANEVEFEMTEANQN